MPGRRARENSRRENILYDVAQINPLFPIVIPCCIESAKLGHIRNLMLENLDEPLQPYLECRRLHPLIALSFAHSLESISLFDVLCLYGQECNVVYKRKEIADFASS